MRSNAKLFSLIAAGLLALSLTGPVEANSGTTGDVGDVAGKGTDGKGTDGKGTDGKGTDTGGKGTDTGDKGMDKGTDNGDKGTDKDDPGQPSTANPGGGNRQVDGHGPHKPICAKPDPRLLTKGGKHVGNIIRVKCLKERKTLYTVDLVPPFNTEARRVTFTTDGRPKEGSVVRLDMTAHQVNKLIWMSVPH